jgi:hypothetical protein
MGCHHMAGFPFHPWTSRTAVNLPSGCATGVAFGSAASGLADSRVARPQVAGGTAVAARAGVWAG